jgi:hypothetical protein
MIEVTLFVPNDAAAAAAAVAAAASIDDLLSVPDVVQ